MAVRSLGAELAPGKSRPPTLEPALANVLTPNPLNAEPAPARRVEEVGPATVEDVSTMQYHAVLDLRRATAQVDGATKDQFQSMLDAGVTALEYEIWVDVNGLPRRFSADIPTTSGLYSVTGIYRDWGRKVSIAAPKAKQLSEADKLKG